LAVRRVDGMLADMLRHRGPAISLLGAAFLATLRVHADAVPPPPDDCPSGMVGVTGHGGPHCEKEAPKNCPNGWQGMIGGLCVLSVCSADADCQGDGKVCKKTSLCYEPHERTTTCGSNERARPGPELASPGSRVLGAPCATLPEPVTDWEAVNICGGSEPCASPSECRPSGLCVTPSAPAPAAQRGNSSGTVEPKPSGCGSGCVGAPSPGKSGAAFGALGVLGLLAARRWRRK
jgi:hypothetical protein